MNHLGNKLLIYAICCYIIWFLGINTILLSACIVSLTCTCLCTYFEKSRITSLILLGFLLISLIEPFYGVFLPLTLYDANLYCKWKSIERRTDWIDVLPIPLTIGVFLRTLHYMSGLLILPLIIILLLAYLLSHYSRKNDTLRQKLHHIQDENAESTLILKEKNKSLIRQQDYDIHVATLSERNRIAREIHDNVGHMLTRSILQMGALKIINKDPVLAEPLTELNETLNTAMTSIRSSVHDLHDEAIDLRYVLDDIVSHVNTFSIHLDYDMGTDIPKDIKYAFITIIKEAINNIQKHSNATQANIYVREHPAFFQLQIDDNGVVGQPMNENGIGLSNMRERVNALHGNLKISTEHGFCIFISIMK